MAINVVRTLADGSTLVQDDADGREFVLKPGQLAELRARGSGRAALEELVAANRTEGDPRTQQEQEQVQANEQGQGERAQESERG